MLIKNDSSAESRYDLDYLCWIYFASVCLDRQECLSHANKSIFLKAAY